jgi:hypothetical protein
MPDRPTNKDWAALVRERLHSLNLPPNEVQEVIAELAAHLEDLYEEQLKQGCSEAEARQRVANNEVGAWRPLAKRIQRIKRKEETMNPRTKHFWLPGLVSLTTAMLLLRPLIANSTEPRLLGRSPLETVLLPWLLLLPLCGAAGAYLSRRSGGNVTARLVAGLFPTIALLALGLILVPARLVTFAHPEWRYGFIALAVAVVFPSAALLLGTAPFLRPAR